MSISFIIYPVFSYAISFCLRNKPGTVSLFTLFRMQLREVVVG